MQKSIWSYFKSSAAFTAFAVVACYFLAGVQGAFLALILGVLETSLSVDNAVVNAKYLKDMDEKWKHRFLTWGMWIAVFGMRVVFPILIVWMTSPMSFTESIYLPFTNRHQYAEYLMAAHVSIAGFGGAFLLMVFLSFFMDAEKDEHWIPGVEKLISWFSIKGDNSNIFYTMAHLSATTAAIVYAIGYTLEGEAHAQFLHSALYGGLTYIGVQLLGHYFEQKEAAGGIAKGGAMAFLYLELLDASFSFDGVIGAFAMTDDIILIALGLGIGAFFVRSMTLLMVDRDTLGQFKYLEHGAFWSIGVLALCMFLGVTHHIPEVVTGIATAAILVIAVVHSMLVNKQEVKAA